MTDFPKLRGSSKPCHACKLGKANGKSFKGNFKPANFPGEIVHSDLVGTLPVSLDGAVYACSFMDQFLMYAYAVGISNKSGVSQIFEEYKAIEHVKRYFP